MKRTGKNCIVMPKIIFLKKLEGKNVSPHTEVHPTFSEMAD
jgi:hypothetical protein